MAVISGTEEVLKAADYWKERSLIADKSVFTDETLWTLAYLDELNRYFVENLNMGTGTFTEKLKAQIAPVSPQAKRLAAEMLWVMMLFPSKTSARRQTKLGLVQEVWSWSESNLPPDHPLLGAPLEAGIGNTGRAYPNLRYAELVFFIQFLRRFKGEGVDRRRAILADPWLFANYLDRSEGADKRQLRHILLHLLFPRTFERIASAGDRAAVDEFYSQLLSETDRTRINGESPTVSLDRRLGRIREALNLQESEDFYRNDLKAQWKDGEPSGDPDEESDENNGLRENMERVLSEYATARMSDSFSGGHPIAAAFAKVKQLLARLDSVRSRPSLRVGWSTGKGNWARVPWISFLDARETPTTKRGVYCVYLFRQDMSGVYLTFNQGVTEPLVQLGQVRGREFLRETAVRLRQNALALEAAGFSLDDRIDLRAEGGLGTDYEDSTIAYKLYEAGAVPSDADLERDLSAVLGAYDDYLQQAHRGVNQGRSTRSWIFQANPELYALRDASKRLEELTWLVKQYESQIASDDRVFLWESGPRGGIVATATVLSGPRSLPLPPKEREFVRNEDKIGGNQPRVRLRIDKRLDPVLERSQLLDVPGLRELLIFRQPVGTNFPLTPEQAATLNRLIEEPKVLPVAPRKDLHAVHQSFASSLAASNISFGPRHGELTRTFVASLATKPFLILTGLSGSGKTQMALKFGQWCGVQNVLVVPVRPDWTGSEALFGYEDALIPPVDGARVWHVPDALEFMLRAAGDPTKPYVLILDEMNLAHVERYFADVLSGMESGVSCLPNLRLDEGYWLRADPTVPHLKVPDNLIIIGTVNVDETTYTFSPKVLDRANTIEFRVSADEMNLEAKKPIDAAAGPDDLVRGFLAVLRDSAFQQDNPSSHLQQFQQALKSLHEILGEGGFEFGHRVFYEAIRFAAMYDAAGGERWEDALDFQVLQKLLPRLHGSRRKLEPTLDALAAFCVDLGSARLEGAEKQSALAFSEGTARLPRSLNKLKRMARNLRANQFASFTE